MFLPQGFVNKKGLTITKIMKKNKINTLIIVILISFSSCERVIDLDLKTSQERLVIEAFINWEKGTSGNEQVIKLSKTASYFSDQTIRATGATVVIIHQNGTQYVFNETTEGIYNTTTFQPEFGASYTLQIIYNGESYTATETFIPVPEIDEITQSIEEDDDIDIPVVNVFFTDIPNVENFYRISYKITRINNGNTSILEGFTVYNDEFEDGNQLTDFYAGFKDDIIEISLLGLTERFFNYTEQLIILSDPDEGPFSIPPVNVKGNCINTTNSSNYPYGYFRLSEVDKETYVFQ